MVSDGRSAPWEHNIVAAQRRIRDLEAERAAAQGRERLWRGKAKVVDEMRLAAQQEAAQYAQAVEDVWSFVGHHPSCATRKRIEAIGPEVRCDCGLRDALHRGNVKKARAALGKLMDERTDLTPPES